MARYNFIVKGSVELLGILHDVVGTMDVAMNVVPVIAEVWVPDRDTFIARIEFDEHVEREWVHQALVDKLLTDGITVC